MSVDEHHVLDKSITSPPERVLYICRVFAKERAMTQTDLSKRTPEEVFTHHAQSLGAEDLEAIMMDYADSAILINPSGVRRGKDAIRKFFADLLQALPKAQWGVKTIYAGDVLFLEWTADSARASVSDGVDTFIFQNGLITLQTVRNTIVPKA
jgi:predicted SnoaL-like aldol condensation-catalyzing enzyme